MDGITFTTAAPVAVNPARMDVACFVGYVGRRPVRDRIEGETDRQYMQQLPAWLRQWFDESDWRPGFAGRTARNLVELFDVPVPIDTWETFDALFAWDARPLDPSGRRCHTVLGAAVRRFFAQGGRKCYVVRVGDPWMVLAPAEARRTSPSDYVPVLPPPSPVDRRTWRGVGHLFGLREVSFLCLPDLPDVCSRAPSRLPRHQERVPIERFVECADRTEPSQSGSLRAIAPPACDATGFFRWNRLVSDVTDFVSRHAREVQFVAAVPPAIDERALVGVSAAERIVREARDAQMDAAREIHSRFAQLVYPWIRTRESAMLPGDLEAPDAALVGLLAENALSHATWTNLTHHPVRGILALEPVLDRATLQQSFPPPQVGGTVRAPHRLRDRVSVIGPSPRGFRLLSDVTTAGGRQGGPDADEPYRAANVHRLLAAILRAARIIGQDLVFENNGEALWSRLREGLENFLAAIWADGALAGATAGEAFEVRCDRSTMKQADLDAGRVIVRLAFTAAMPIVHITVIITLDEGDRISLVAQHSTSSATAVAASA